MSVVRCGRENFQDVPDELHWDSYVKTAEFFCSEVLEIYEPLNCLLGTAGNDGLFLSFILDWKVSGRGTAFFVCLAESWQNRGLSLTAPHL